MSMPIPTISKSFESRSKVADQSRAPKSLDLNALLATPDPTGENAQSLASGKMNEVIKQIIAEEGLTQGELASKLGMKSQSGVTQALQRDMRNSMAMRFLDVLGAELVIKYKGHEYKIIES